MRRYPILLMLFTAGVSPGNAIAVPTYTELSVIRTTVDTAGVEVNPYISSLKLGVALSNQLSVELEYGKGMQNDESDNVKIEVEKHTGVYLRYSGDSSYNGVFFYLIAGSVETEFSVESGGVTATDSVKDIAYGIGAEERSETFRNMVYSLDYIRYLDKDNTEMSGIRLGFRFQF